MNLKELKIGEICTVKKLLGEGEVYRRLLDLGITPGVKIEVKTIAPFGDPIIIKLRGYELSLIKKDAQNVIVEKITKEKK